MEYWVKASYWWSTVFLFFAIFCTFYSVAAGWTGSPLHGTSDNVVGIGVANVLLFTILMIWIGILEGSQMAYVGLANTDPDSLAAYPQCQKVCALVHKNQNLERFIVGRQLLLVFIVFLFSKLGSHSKRNEAFHIGSWEWQHWADAVFLQNGILLTITLAVPAQLASQLMAIENRQKFLCLKFAPYWTSAVPALALERTGVVHCAYVIKDLFARVSGMSMDPKTVMPKNVLYIIRAVFSVCLVLFFSVCIFKGIFDKQMHTSIEAGWSNVPPWALVLILVLVLCIVGLCEGLQIAAVKLMSVPKKDLEDLYSHPIGRRSITMLRRGNNLKSFLVGRQLFVASIYVIVAHVTTFSGSDGHMINGNFWNFSPAVIAVLLQSGFAGAIFLTNVAILSCRTAASCFPQAFLKNPVVYALLCIILAADFSGVVASAHPVSWFFGWLCDIKETNGKSKPPQRNSSDSPSPSRTMKQMLIQ